MAIELEAFEGKANYKQLKMMKKGAEAEIEVLNMYVNKLKHFISTMVYIHDDEQKKMYENDENIASSESASQHIGYLESKIMESMGTIDKIALELASQIDRGKENDNTATTD